MANYFIVPKLMKYAKEAIVARIKHLNITHPRVDRFIAIIKLCYPLNPDPFKGMLWAKTRGPESGAVFREGNSNLQKLLMEHPEMNRDRYRLGVTDDPSGQNREWGVTGAGRLVRS